MINFDCDSIEDYDELVEALDRFESRSKPKRLELEMKNCASPPAKPFIDEPLKLELKALPPHLRYVFLGKDSTFPVTIFVDLSVDQVKAVISVLRKFKRVIGWTIAGVNGIPLDICSHKIKFMLYNKSSIEH